MTLNKSRVVIIAFIMPELLEPPIINAPAQHSLVNFSKMLRKLNFYSNRRNLVRVKEFLLSSANKLTSR